MMNKTAHIHTAPKRKAGDVLMKAIRVITIPPILAVIAFAVMFALRPAYFGGVLNLLLSILFICVLPAAGYALQPLLPAFRDKGREGQRQLAMYTATAGYVIANIYAALAGISNELWWFYAGYLVSGLLVLVCNRLLHIRASGHACGIAGPIILLAYAFGPWALLGLLLLPIVFYASIKMGRHTPGQLVVGSLLPVIAAPICALALHLPPWFARLVS